MVLLSPGYSYREVLLRPQYDAWWHVQELNPGDTIRFRYQDDAAERTVVVVRRVSNKSAGMADETEFYIASSLEVAETQHSNPENVECITFATDGNAYLDGRPITVELSR